MDQDKVTQAALLSKLETVVRGIEANELHDALLKGESFIAMKEAYFKGYNDTPNYRAYIASLGYKPGKAEFARRFTERWGALIKKHDIPVLTSRLSACLSLEQGTDEQELSILQELCSSTVPHAHYKSSLNAYKGKLDISKPECDHLGKGREVWYKCLDCGTWIPDPNNKG
jgi:hypothetical protein